MTQSHKDLNICGVRTNTIAKNVLGVSIGFKF